MWPLPPNPNPNPNPSALADKFSLPVPALLKSHQVSTLGYALKVVEHRWPTLGTKATSVLGASGNLLATCRAADLESTKACRATEHFHRWGDGGGGRVLLEAGWVGKGQGALGRSDGGVQEWQGDLKPVPCHRTRSEAVGPGKPKQA